MNQAPPIPKELDALARQAVDAAFSVHRAQLLTYLKLTGRRLGLLINFNVPIIKQGITRVAL